MIQHLGRHATVHIQEIGLVTREDSMTLKSKNTTKRKYLQPKLAKYDSLNKITLASHVPRGPCPNYPDPSCAISGISGPAYKGGPNADPPCCTP